MTNFECDYIYTNQKNEWEENIKLYVYKSSYNFYLRCYQTAKIKIRRKRRKRNNLINNKRSLQYWFHIFKAQKIERKKKQEEEEKLAQRKKKKLFPI